MRSVGFFDKAGCKFRAMYGARRTAMVAADRDGNAHDLAAQLTATGKFKVLNDTHFFNEFTVACDEAPARLNARLRAEGIIGGYDLSAVDASRAGRMLLCATEMTGPEAIGCPVAGRIATGRAVMGRAAMRRAARARASRALNV